MKCARLVSAKKIELAEVADPGRPNSREVLVEVLSVGICGSDLHMYETASIGGIPIDEPLILGHEFSGRILEAGPEALTEFSKPLGVGMRVAVDPHVACGHCRLCLEGHPNLCPDHTFMGVAPSHGALCERMIVPAKNCHPLPDELSDDSGALLEPLGVALHAVDLAKVRSGDVVSVIGCGPIGLLIARLCVLSGAARTFAFDPLEWRVRFAGQWGIEALNKSSSDGVADVLNATKGMGADVVIEAAWADGSVQDAMDMARPGGRLVMAGIPPDDQFRMSHSVARRKGLTIRMARRMKHTYPRAIQLASGPDPKIALDEMVTLIHKLDAAPKAFAENAEYLENLIKGVIRPSGG